ncbi:MAG TPA: catalase-peroxidase, partial [Saprospiraceae bacterium]|nr:catalase-peroxidase [Saprospiraceae bacterium]
GVAAIEKAAYEAGVSVKVPFAPGRADATQEQTDIDSFGALEPQTDGFRNYAKGHLSKIAEHLLVDKAQLLNLTAPEMSVLVAGMRVMAANFDGSTHGVFTAKPGVLSNDFFVNVLDLNTAWTPTSDKKELFVGTNKKTGEKVGTATRVDLIFGSNTELRAIAEVYASEDEQTRFVHDFVKAWNKVMNSDLF